MQGIGRMMMWASLFIAGFFLTGLAVQWLWNWLVPGLFNGPVIVYYQALGLLVLCRILFKGFFWSNGYGGRCGSGSHWKSKWNTMTDEEREKFKQKMRERCGWAEK